jgi:Xaa-Pro aminopeptidase
MSGSKDTLFIPPPDTHAERWSGRRVKPLEAADASGVQDIRYSQDFTRYFDNLVTSDKIEQVYLIFDKLTSVEPDDEAYKLAGYIKERYPFIAVKNLLPLLKKQRTIKKTCEIEAMRQAEKAARAGILAMMRASRPDMYEYEYKAEFDYAISKMGISPAFPLIISSGQNNFCIHYNSYAGKAVNGDFILNDVGASWDNIATDVSRGFPCNGKFSEKQRLLYQCAYDTSEYMFSIIKPGMPMGDVDSTIRQYNFERLKDIGLLDDFKDIGKYMWHGGAHHVGYDVHDVVHAPHDMPLSPGMVFCVDIGIYCEEWGIGFRLEDNCLITETGCENLSAAIPRTIDEIESVMR